MIPTNEFMHQAFIIGGVSIWEWDVTLNSFTLLGQFADAVLPLKRTLGKEAFYELIHPDDREQVSFQLTNTLEHGGKFEIEFRLANAGNIQWIMGLGDMVQYEAGNKILGVFINTSDRKKKAELFSKRQTQFANLVRLSSMGEMASLLAHEISQPLVVINTYIAGCIRRLEEEKWDKEKIIGAMKKANEHVELAGHLIHRLKNYIRKEGLHYQQIDIHQIIKSAVSLIGYESSQHPLNMQYEFGKLPEIKCDELQIKFVILSIINNAIDAMIASGSHRPKITIQTRLFNDRTLIMSVIDSGDGISPTLKEKLFNAYCSTKPDGTGLTLLICRGIIEAHSGYISAENLLTGGARFNVVLPLLTEQ